MKRLLTWRPAGVAVLAFALLPLACAGDRPDAEESDMAEMQQQAPPELPGAMLYIQHEVEDFDAWLPVYDGFDDERAAANVVEMWVHRDVDQPSRVHALHGAADIETLRNFTQMEELASAMQEAGVVGQPRFEFMTLDLETVPDSLVQSQYNLLVRHEVADYDAWKAVYDEHAPAREAAGLTSRGIGRDAANPNVVYMNFAIGDLAAARAFVASEDLGETMERAGVVGEPEIYFTETVRPM